ncbi:MAG TPA: flagellar basal body rod protein FlgB [Verrucomicrobiae bacterium]|jgi:flagellar basal-body rod protein FlgB|nr:flagellar basal body rod protein FlgB [Verrucomicrobiae bacterium]
MAGFTLFGATQQLLSLSMRLRSMRHELLAGNIANADTPGYRARDLDFSAALKALVAPEKGGRVGPDARLQLIAARPSDDSMPVEDALVQVQEVEGKLDGNSVDLDRQIATLVENSLSYETSLTLLGRTLANLRYAISEGKR